VWSGYGVGHGEFLARFLAPPEFDLGLIAGGRCLRLAACGATEQGRHFISKTRPVCASVSGAAGRLARGLVDTEQSRRLAIHAQAYALRDMVRRGQGGKVRAMILLNSAHRIRHHGYCPVCRPAECRQGSARTEAPVIRVCCRRAALIVARPFLLRAQGRVEVLPKALPLPAAFRWAQPRPRR